MTNRRKILTGALSVDASDHKAMNPIHATSENRGAVPDVGVITHTGKPAKLYSDLIDGRVVTINFMSIKREAAFPVSARLAEMAALLGDRLGRDVHMISITTDSDHDTVERLSAFHREMGGHAGWTFVHTPLHSAQMVAHRFYRHGRDVALNGRLDIIQYGNAKAGLWGAFPWDIKPHDAADRVSWVMPRAVHTGEHRRAGPRPLDGPGQRWNNRLA